MSRCVYGYPLGPRRYGPQEIALPSGGQFLSALVDHGQIVVYAMVDPELAVETRTVYVYPTRLLDLDGGAKRFLGTVEVGEYVFHIFADR